MSEQDFSEITAISEEMLEAILAIAHAITSPVVTSEVVKEDATGNHVLSLTDAVMGMTAGLVEIAGAIERLAEAVAERGEP